MFVYTIVTHEYPDLDAVLCCYLLKKYGKERYGGIEDAKIEFYPAGRLPEGKTPDELEQQGILAVDIGGGRLDTHPDEGNQLSEAKKSLSAANLVARDLGVDQNETLVNLLEFARRHDSEGRSLSSKNPVDHLVALPNLIRGASFYFKDSFLELVKFFFKVFEAIEASEKERPQREQDNYFENVAVEENQIFLPNPSIKGLLAHFLMKKYVDRSASVVCAPFQETAQIFKNFSDFMTKFSIPKLPELEKLIGFTENVKPGKYLLASSNAIDETVTLVNIIYGFGCSAQAKQGDLSWIQDVFQMFNFAIAYEKNWYEAIEEYQEKHQLHRVGNVKIATVEAERGVVVKVARWLDKADITVFRDAKRHHISISLNRLGRLKNWSFKRLAARLRVAELYYNSSFSPENDYFQIGEVTGWFLHQSEKLLLHGSPKAYREPSQIPFSAIIELVITEIDRGRKLADEFCPPQSCEQDTCNFFPLRLPNCFEHRKNIRENMTQEGTKKNQV